MAATPPSEVNSKIKFISAGKRLKKNPKPKAHSQDSRQTLQQESPKLDIA